MKLLLWLLLVVGSSYANAVDDFMPIDLVGNYQDSGVKVKISNISNLAMLELENTSVDLLTCEGVFHSGPEPDVIRRVALKPGAEKAISAKFFRHVIKLRIAVNCEQAP